jgi:hypothetical protein
VNAAQIQFQYRTIDGGEFIALDVEMLLIS